MKSIVNSEIISVTEFQRYKRNPYPNSDFDIGRNTNPINVLKGFAENLLLYDRIYISTASFEEVVTIKNWLGGHLLEDLLHQDILYFVQTPFSWTYIQKWKKDKGIRTVAGIANVFIADEETVRFKSQSGVGKLDKSELGGWSSPDLEKAVTYTLTKFHKYNTKKIGKFARLVARHSIQLNSDAFRSFITNKSDEELHNKTVRNALGFHENNDVDNIPDNSPDIRRIFRIISANQNLAIMNSLPQADLMPEKFHMEVLRYPLTNEIRKTKLYEKTKELFGLERLPIPEILGTELPLEEVIKIRNSDEGIKFRKWIHDHLDKNDDIKSAYIDLLRRKPPFAYRLINTIALPLISSGIGGSVTKLAGFTVDATLGAVSEFKIQSLAERFLVPNPPKFLMDKIKEIIKKNKSIS